MKVYSLSDISNLLRVQDSTLRKYLILLEDAGIINNRKVIGIDNSDVAIEVMKQSPLLKELEIINKKTRNLKP